MIGGKDWLDLILVTTVALGFITLMLVIQGAQHGHTRRKIAGTVALVWGAVGLTVTLAWLLEGRWGGALIDVQVAPEPKVVTRSLTRAQAWILGGMVAAMLAAYVTAIVAVRRLMQPTDALTVESGDERGSDRE